MLFDPFICAGIPLKNRIVRSATYEKRASDAGFVTDSLVRYYEELTRGGSGLIITGNVVVHPTGANVPQVTCIYRDAFIDGLSRLSGAIHDLGGKVVAQLVHSGRQTFPSLIGGVQPVAPSEVHDSSIDITPRAMTDAEIWEMIDAFGESALRVKEAGFDGLQIHGAHGYLVSEFLSPYTNRRDDYWGGDEERRFHFPEEVFKAMRQAVGRDYPVMIKMNGDDFIEGGLEPEESLRIAKRLEHEGIGAIEVSGGMYESRSKPARPNILKEEQEAYFRDISRCFRSELNVPIILVGGIRSRNVAEDVLSEGDADLISLSRPLIREPDLPNKFKEGKERADCISCNGCMRFMKLDMVRCTQLEAGESG